MHCKPSNELYVYSILTLNEIFSSFVVDCEVPSAPANGTVSVTNGTNYGAQVDFQCDTGFRLVGNASNVCNLSGQWEPGPPNCQVIGSLF